MSFNAIRQNKILAKVSEFTVVHNPSDRDRSTDQLYVPLVALLLFPWQVIVVKYNSAVRQVKVSSMIQAF